MRPRPSAADADLAAHATAALSRWTHRVGVTGRDCNSHPHPDAPNELAPSGLGSGFSRRKQSALTRGASSSPLQGEGSEAWEEGAISAARPQLMLHDAPAMLAAVTETNGHTSTGMLRPIGQAGPGYLVAEGPHGLVLVDQHAAHERILFNRLLERLRTGRGTSQPLLIPQALEEWKSDSTDDAIGSTCDRMASQVTPAQVAALEAAAPAAASVVVEEDWYAIAGVPPAPDLTAAIAAWAASEGLLVVESRSVGGSLEDAYLALVGAA